MNKIKVKTLREINDILIAIDSNSSFSSISKPLMKLYAVRNLFSKKFFDSKEELEEYIKNYKLGKEWVWISTIEYYEHLAGREDVIVCKEYNQKPILKAVYDELAYVEYNPSKSIESKDFIWEYIEGTLEEEYSAFRDRGIKFKNDIYARVDQTVEELKKWYNKDIIKTKLKVYSNQNNDSDLDK